MVLLIISRLSLALNLLLVRTILLLALLSLCLDLSLLVPPSSFHHLVELGLALLGLSLSSARH